LSYCHNGSLPLLTFDRLAAIVAESRQGVEE
jgi:hypothetical protein